MADDTKPAAGSTGRGADLRTFLIADIRGYTRFTRDRGDEAASSLAAWFAAVVRDVVSASDGELLELRGDEALCVFSSARQALRAAVELQRRLRVASNERIRCSQWVWESGWTRARRCPLRVAIEGVP